LSESLKTTRFEPPANEVDVFPAGMRAVAYLSANSSPPSCSSEPIMNGPSMNAPTRPSTKSASVAPGVRSACAFARPWSKKDV
jgi:hypothetical protein